MLASPNDPTEGFSVKYSTPEYRINLLLFVFGMLNYRLVITVNVEADIINIGVDYE